MAHGAVMLHAQLSGVRPLVLSNSSQKYIARAAASSLSALLTLLPILFIEGLFADIASWAIGWTSTPCSTEP